MKSLSLVERGGEGFQQAQFARTPGGHGKRGGAFAVDCVVVFSGRDGLDEGQRQADCQTRGEEGSSKHGDTPMAGIHMTLRDSGWCGGA